MDEVEKSFVEHRGWPRNAIDKFIDKAQLLLPAEATQESPTAEIVNLSAAGAGVLTPMRIKKGTHVKLQILGKEIPTLDLEAEVRWSAQSPVSTGQYPIGLKFRPLEKQRQAKLRDFIEIIRKHRPPSE